MSPDLIWRRAEEMRRAAQLLLNRAAELERQALEKARENSVSPAIVVLSERARKRPVCAGGQAPYELALDNKHAENVIRFDPGEFTS